MVPSGHSVTSEGPPVGSVRIALGEVDPREVDDDTAFAADQLGDVTFVELPKVGDKFKIDQKFGVIESVKSVSDLFMPVGGQITAVNDRLSSEPELVNNDCYGEGWMIKVKVDNKSELESALSADAYKDFVVE